MDQHKTDREMYENLAAAGDGDAALQLAWLLQNDPKSIERDARIVSLLYQSFESQCEGSAWFLAWFLSSIDDPRHIDISQHIINSGDVRGYYTLSLNFWRKKISNDDFSRIHEMLSRSESAGHIPSGILRMRYLLKNNPYDIVSRIRLCMKTVILIWKGMRNPDHWTVSC